MLRQLKVMSKLLNFLKSTPSRKFINDQIRFASTPPSPLFHALVLSRSTLPFLPAFILPLPPFFYYVFTLFLTQMLYAKRLLPLMLASFYEKQEMIDYILPLAMHNLELYASIGESLVCHFCNLFLCCHVFVLTHYNNKQKDSTRMSVWTQVICCCFV